MASPGAERWSRLGAPAGLFLLALAVRLPALGRFLTPDEFLWIDRSRNFLAGLLNPAYLCSSPVDVAGLQQAVGLSCTLRTGHPGVTTMWTGSLGLLLHYLASGQPGSLFDFVADQRTNPLDAALIVPERLPSVVLLSLWVGLVYWLVSRLLDSRPVALVAGLLVALDPFQIALSRVIHHDALATAFMTVSLLTALMYWGRQRSRWWLVVSGTAGGLAFLSKSSSLFLNPFIALIGVWALVAGWRRGEGLAWRVAATLGDGLLWFGCAAAVFFVVWPAMWVIPQEAVGTVFSTGFKYASGGHAKGDYFLGDVSSDPGPLFYPVSWLLRSTPLVWAGLAALGYAAWKGWRARRQAVQAATGWPALGLLAGYAILFVAFMTLGEKKQDRYILPVYPALSILAAVGLVQWVNLRHRLLLAVVFLVQGALVVASYPYFFTYYNPLLGGIQSAEHTLTVGWGEGMDLAADYLNRKPDADRLQVSAWYQSTFAPFFKGTAVSYAKEKGKALSGDYVVFYINQLQRRFPDDELFRYFESRYQPEAVIPLRGVDYVVIYPGPHLQHYVEDRVDENQRAYRGIAALLGWDWLTAPGAATPHAKPGSGLPFRLYWEYLGKRPEEHFFFRLAGPTGRVVAEGLSQPLASEDGEPGSWRQGQIIVEQGELPVPAGTPSGDYRLQIGFYTQAPAVPEGELRFALPPEEAVVRVEPAVR